MTNVSPQPSIGDGRRRLRGRADCDGRAAFAFVVLSLARRRVLHVNVTSHLTAAWTAQQMVEALPWTPTARYLIRDRDGVYREVFKRRVEGLGLQQVLIAAPGRTRMQSASSGRCAENASFTSSRSTSDISCAYVHSYVAYYNRTRTHLALGKDPVLATNAIRTLAVVGRAA